MLHNSSASRYPLACILIFVQISRYISYPASIAWSMLTMLMFNSRNIRKRNASEFVAHCLPVIFESTIVRLMSCCLHFFFVLHEFNFFLFSLTNILLLQSIQESFSFFSEFGSFLCSFIVVSHK
jgi:hypothetical protein